MDINVPRSFSQCFPIRCIKSINDWILIAEGLKVIVQSESNGKIINEITFLSKQRKLISGLTIGNFNNRKSLEFAINNNYPLLVYGDKFGQIANLFLLEDELIFENFERDFDQVIDFGDWVTSAEFIYEEKNSGWILAVLTAHNSIAIYNVIFENYSYRLEFLSRHQSVPCILYSATIYGKSRFEILIFSGTVFREIIIWTITKGDNGSEILHTLPGHEGVIFSINYYEEQNLIISTSDDRSIRIWEVGGENGMDGILNKKSTIKLKGSFYGHTGRVWNAVLALNKIISVGEDSKICIWNMEGILIRSWEAHGSASIWSSHFFPRKSLLLTGGADGGVYKWYVDVKPVEPTILEIDQRFDGLPKHESNKDFPRCIMMDNMGSVFSIMESGRLINISKDYLQTDLFYDEKLLNYSVMDISFKKDMILLGSKSGELFVLRIFHKDDKLEYNCDLLWKRRFKEKIFSVKWLSLVRLLITFQDKLILLQFITKSDLEPYNFDVEIFHEFSYKVKRPGVNTAMEYISTQGNFLLVGDEQGGIHFYKYGNSETIKVLKAHGKHGTTSIIKHPIPFELNSKTNAGIFSCGRNGMLKKYSITNGELIETYSEKLPFDWAGGVYSTQDFGLIIVGFLSTDFVIYKWDEKRIMTKIYCGGGHRSWDFSFHDFIPGASSFAFIRDKIVYFAPADLKSFMGPAIKEGFHAKTINCAIKINNFEETYIITGSEDNMIRVSHLRKANGGFISLDPKLCFGGHTSAVRCLASTNASHSKNIYYIFSGGGKSELFVWKLILNDNSVNNLNDNSINCSELSHLNLSKEKDDMRVMCLSPIKISQKLIRIAIGCSDGFVRILEFNESTEKLRIYLELECVGDPRHAVVKTMYSNSFVFAATSNGFLCVWRVELDTSVAVGMELVPVLNERIHSCAITAFDASIGEISEIERFASFLIYTGGEDSKVKVYNFYTSRDDLSYIGQVDVSYYIDLKEELSWHRATITGIKFIQILKENGEIGNSLVTTSADQLLIYYTKDENDQFVPKIYSPNVQDPQDLLLISNGELGNFVMIYGQGFSIFPI